LANASKQLSEVACACPPDAVSEKRIEVFLTGCEQTLPFIL